MIVCFDKPHTVLPNSMLTPLVTYYSTAVLGVKGLKYVTFSVPCSLVVLASHTVLYLCTRRCCNRWHWRLKHFWLKQYTSLHGLQYFSTQMLTQKAQHNIPGMLLSLDVRHHWTSPEHRHPYYLVVRSITRQSIWRFEKMTSIWELHYL